MSDVLSSALFYSSIAADVLISTLSVQDWIQDERVLEEATQKVALIYQSFRWAVALLVVRLWCRLAFSTDKEFGSTQGICLFIILPSSGFA